MKLCRVFVLSFAVLVSVTLGPLPMHAQQPASAMPAILNKVSIEQRLNQQVPPDITFRDEEGQAVQLGKFFGNKPILLSLVYFDCPALCTEVLNSELRTMRSMVPSLGPDFDAVTVSFEPTDTPALAKAKRDVYAGQYNRKGAVDNWHFLTGSQVSIDAITRAVGFHYAYDSTARQYAHAAAIMVLTPDGRISRYFYGVQYPVRDVRLGLVEASKGRIGTIADHALLYCYQYDPITGKYGWVVMNVVRAAGIFTVLVLGIFMFVMFRSERHKPIASTAAGAKLR